MNNFKNFFKFTKNNLRITIIGYRNIAKQELWLVIIHQKYNIYNIIVYKKYNKSTSLNLIVFCKLN